MLVVEIRDGTAKEESVTSRRNGQSMTFRRQEAWVQLNGETRRVRISLGREQAPYLPGKYQLDDASFGVNEYSDLVVKRLTLRSIATPAAQPSAASAAGR